MINPFQNGFGPFMRRVPQQEKLVREYDRMHESDIGAGTVVDPPTFETQYPRVRADVTNLVGVLQVTSGGLGASSLTDHGVLVGSGESAVTALTVGTNGQVLVGSTGVDPVFANISAGAGISITEGAGTLGIASTVTGFTSEAAQDAVGGILTDTTTIDFTYNDSANTITADVLIDGLKIVCYSGDVVTHNDDLIYN